MINIDTLKTTIIDLAVSGKISSGFDIKDSVTDIISVLPAISNKRKNLLEQKFEYGKQPLIPPHWKWTKLGEITTYGDTPTKAYFDEIDSNTWLLDLEDIKTGGEVITKTRVQGKKFTGDKSVFRKDQVLYSKLRPYLKKVLVADEDGISTPELISFDVFGGIIPQYIVYCLLSTFTTKAIDKRSYGIKMPRVDAGFMVNLPIPLPPVSEQQYIVARVQAAFAQIDTIDKLQAQYSSNLSILKSKLVDIALQGKLSDQLLKDDSVVELIQKIKNEKQALIKCGKINSDKLLPKIEKAPYSLPKNWQWVRWGELSFQIQYGYNAPAKEKGRIKMVRITDIQDGRVLWDTVPYCEIEEDEIGEYLLKPGNILFARTGGTVGKSYLVDNVEQEAVFAGYLIRTSFSSQLNSKYIKYFMNSSLYWKQLQDGTTATAQPNCNAKTLSKMMIPLPSFAEQKRIVEKLDNIFATLDRVS